MSRAKDDRPELLLTIKKAQKGNKFVVYKLDRLARSTRQLIEIAELFRDKDVKFVSIQDNLDTVTAASKAMFGMLSVLAEFK
ncbi:recombinase family protein [Planococcus rifietoensis]|uniref:recombinase family protein n=1 Tax=Planococcus rifietoensis TaxID=200991 RepID=UPI0038B653AC